MVLQALTNEKFDDDKRMNAETVEEDRSGNFSAVIRAGDINVI